ncbi:hypothetical protein JMG10_00300 [Nostoc ellipsosporum NOK]|jgi:hypothetical protein|nr:hypothetical protein [Nostoc ellipsosporum NOK]
MKKNVLFRLTMLALALVAVFCLLHFSDSPDVASATESLQPNPNAAARPIEKGIWQAISNPIYSALGF